MSWKIEAGDMTVQIGGASNEVQLSDTFTIQRDAWMDGKTRGFYAETNRIC